MKLEEVVSKYPHLVGLYIPQAGEIIYWGRKAEWCAITAQSPLEEEGGPLKVISLNSDGFAELDIVNYLPFAPREAMPFHLQQAAIEHYDEYYNSRFSKLFGSRPDVKAKWEEYCRK